MATPGRRRLAIVLSAVVAAGAAVLGGTGAAVADGADQVVSVPVEFTVRVENRAVPCLETTANPPTAVVRGTLTGPADALRRGPVAGAVLSHGDGYDETFWTFPDRRYNIVEDLARRGHVSVSYDRLGYGDSDKPNGNGICFGHEATVLDQVLDQLRAGTYRAEGAQPRFSRIALVGHSASGLIVEQTAGLLGGVDALGAISTGLEASTPLVVQRAVEQQGRCLTAPDGYAGLEGDDAQFRADHLFDVEPRVAAALTENRTMDACAGTRNLQSIPPNSLTNIANLRVPVLAVAGAQDRFFPNVALHAATFASSPAVTTEVIPRTGHAVAFSGEAARFRDVLAGWLEANRF